MGFPSPKAALQDHHALLGRAALSKEVCNLVAWFSPSDTVALQWESGTTLEINSRNITSKHVVTICYNASSHRRSPVCRVLAKKCHDRLVAKLLDISPDLLQEVHGRDMNCPCNDATCAVFSTKVNHDHILLIPKLGHTKEIQRMHRLWQTKQEKTQRKPQLTMSKST